LDPRVEEINAVDLVVREAAVGPLASAPEGVTFEDAYQWEEINANAAEKRTRAEDCPTARFELREEW
jgi:hypothetical protein